MEILDGVLPLIGVLGGFILGRRERNLRHPIAYRCDCGHSLAKHKDGTTTHGTRCVECSCKQYVGMRPVEELG